MKNDKYHIGSNTLSGDAVRLGTDEILKHWLINGGTGRGKSKLLEGLLQWHIRNGHGVMLLDPHGFLYEDLVAYATAAGYGPRLVLVNANDVEHSVGLNFLERTDLDVSAQASQIMKAISKVFGEGDGDVKPRLERWQRNLLISLIEARLTLADMLDFLSVTSTQYRQAALESVTNSYVKQEWQGFDAIGKRTERENLIEAPLNRASKMILSDPVRRILGQDNSTVDIEDVIEKGAIVLVNLAPTKVARECQQILGILLIDRVLSYATRRTRGNSRRPFFVVVDEAAELTSSDLPYSLQALRKYGVFFTLCFQTLTQIRTLPGYYENVMTNCDVKIAFKSSRDDAKELVEELFVGDIRGDIVKHEIYRTCILPKETVREVVTTTESQSETDGCSNSSGTSYSEGSGFGNSMARVSGVSHQYLDDNRSFLSGPVFSHGDSDSSAHGFSSFDSNSSGYSDSHTDSHANTRSRGLSRSIVPFYEYIRELELASRQYFSIEEMKERFIGFIMLQPQRHCQIKIGDEKTIAIITSFVKDVRVRESDKLRLVARVNEKYTLPCRVVDKMIEDRRTRLIEGFQHRAFLADEKTIEEGRWQRV